MGWNQITDLRTPLFNHIDEGAYIYYVHSYYPEQCDDTIATSHYINAFSGVMRLCGTRPKADHRVAGEASHPMGQEAVGEHGTQFQLSHALPQL